MNHISNQIKYFIFDYFETCEPVKGKENLI